MHFGEIAVFVFKQATRAVGAVFVLVEGLANFGFVLVGAAGADGSDGHGLGRRHLVVAVGELALVAVAADARLNPVLAHFRLVLGVVDPPLVDDLTRRFAFAGFATLLLLFNFFGFLLLFHSLARFQRRLSLFNRSCATTLAPSGLLLLFFGRVFLFSLPDRHCVVLFARIRFVCAL